MTCNWLENNSFSHTSTRRDADGHQMVKLQETDKMHLLS